MASGAPATAVRSLPGAPPRPGHATPRFWIDALVCVVLVGLIAGCYWPVAGHRFVEYDDSDYIFFNAKVRNGLTWDGIVWAFTQPHSANWHPLTWVSHMIDCSLFGLDAGRQHVTSLVIHVLNTVLLYLALRALIAVGRRGREPAGPAEPNRARRRGPAEEFSRPGPWFTPWCCGLVAGLFAIHPQHVESVAWLAERKDLLSGLFWMLTLLAYAWYVAGPSNWRYLVVALCLALGLMSKPMVVTLPAVLLLLDYWPLGRWQLETALPSRRWLPPVRLIVEKLPLVGLVIASSVVTFLVQRGGGAVVKMQGLSLEHRLANALWSYFDYLRQMFWPVDLAFFYPHPTAFGKPMNHDYTLLAGAALAAVTAVVLALHRRWSFMLVGWLWYLGTLVPVIGLVQVGDQARADRYTYLPSIGAYIVVVFGAAALWQWFRARTPQGVAVAVAGAVTAALLGACFLLTFRQQYTWRDTTALATNGLKVTGDNNYMCHFMLGVTLERQGEFEAALASYDTSLHFNDHSPLTLQNTARLLLECNRKEKAEKVARQLVKIRPELAEARVLLAAALEVQERLPEAEQVLRELIAIPGNELEGYSSLALLLGHMKKTDEGLRLLDDAERDPRFRNAAPILLARGVLLQLAGRLDESATMLEAAAQGIADPVKALTFLAQVRMQQGRIDEVVEIYRRMLVVSPFNLKTPLALAAVLIEAGRPFEAVDELRDFLRKFPGNPSALNNLAWILSTHHDPRVRHGAEAVKLAKEACAVPGNITPELLDTLAAAFAEAGLFEDAKSTARESIRLARAAKQEELAREIETRLKLYESGRPYHSK